MSDLKTKELVLKYLIENTREKLLSLEDINKSFTIPSDDLIDILEELSSSGLISYTKTLNPKEWEYRRTDKGIAYIFDNQIKTRESKQNQTFNFKMVIVSSILAFLLNALFYYVIYALELI